MECPHCHAELKMADRLGIEIDYCPKCRGVWLDRGELDKIIERAADDIAPPAPYESRSSHYRSNEHHHKRKKPKSLLKELFDF